MLIVDHDTGKITSSEFSFITMEQALKRLLDILEIPNTQGQ
jgi:hypothetical protein